MVLLGRVYDGLMVDLQAVNEKLVKRSQRILTKLTGHGGDDARAALALAGGNLKLAVLLLHGCDLNEANDILHRAGGQLRAALSLVDKPAQGKRAPEIFRPRRGARHRRPLPGRRLSFTSFIAHEGCWRSVAGAVMIASAMESGAGIAGEGAIGGGAVVPPRVIATLRGVGKTFPNGVVAVKGLDLDIHDGEFVSLLGPSGCGKSTALRMLAGLVPPSQGTITWREKRAPGDLSFVFQEPTLMPWATVAGNVRLPLMLLGRKEAYAPRLQQTLERVGLGAFARYLSARIVRRHEDAGVDRACAGHRSEAAADGRAFCSARRDHALQAQQRPARAVAASCARPWSSSPIRYSNPSISRSASW